MAVSTINTVLKFGTTEESLTKLCRIKSYPDLMGAPEQLETTDLECKAQTFIPGVKSMDSMDFGFNFDLDEYKTMVVNEGVQGYFQLEFGENGEDGIFAWEGSYALGISGGDVNAVREGTITVIPSTEVKLKVD